MAESKNIEAAGPECLTWNCADTAASLQALLKYVEEEAQKSISWYWRNKRTKSFFSQWVQFLAVVLTSAAAIIPIVGQISHYQLLQNALWASLLVGLAAALLALDKAFGFSSGWARYVMAATNIRKSLEEFRMDWAELVAQTCPKPTPEQVAALIQRAKDFRLNVENMVGQETKDWVTEFQNNIAQLEKDVTAQLATMKDQSEKAAQARETANRPGSIQLGVPNADKADAATIRIKLEGVAGVVTDEAVTGSKTWVRLNLVPGIYQVSVSAAVGGKPVSATAAVVVKPGEIAQPELPLPI
jgi:SMODS and SLOG-associating 2TM effector domain 2